MSPLKRSSIFFVIYATNEPFLSFKRESLSVKFFSENMVLGDTLPFLSVKLKKINSLKLYGPNTQGDV